jgi:hypothetical protein
MTDGRLSNEELVSEADRRLLKATGETSVQITKRVAEQIAGEWYGLTDCGDNAIIALLVSELATLQREADEARESLARWMLENSFATGHGDTIFDLLSELKFQLEEQKARAHVVFACHLVCLVRRLSHRNEKHMNAEMTDVCTTGYRMPPETVADRLDDLDRMKFSDQVYSLMMEAGRCIRNLAMRLRTTEAQNQRLVRETSTLRNELRLVNAALVRRNRSIKRLRERIATLPPQQQAAQARDGERT